MPASPTSLNTPTVSDAYFMSQAFASARASNCRSRQVGAILVRDDEIIARGRNRSPEGTRTCLQDGCIKDERDRCQRCVHAEIDALMRVAPAARMGAVLFCTDEPCLTCATTIAGLSLKELVYERSRSRRDHDVIVDLFAQVGTTLRQMPQQVRDTPGGD